MSSGFVEVCQLFLSTFGDCDGEMSTYICVNLHDTVTCLATFMSTVTRCISKALAMSTLWMLLLLLAVFPVVSGAPDPDDPHLQQRMTIHFMVSLGLAGPVIVRYLRDSFGLTVYHVPTIHCWIKKFKEGRTSVLSDKSTGHPTKLTPQKIAEIRALVQEDGNMSVQEMSCRSQLSVGTVY